MEMQFITVGGVLSLLGVFYFYIRWLKIYSRITDYSIPKLLSQGIILPDHVDNKTMAKQHARALNHCRVLILFFLFIAFSCGVAFNVLYEINK